MTSPEPKAEPKPKAKHTKWARVSVGDASGWQCPTCGQVKWSEPTGDCDNCSASA